MNYSTSPTSSTGSYLEHTSRPSSASSTFSHDSMIFKMRYDAGRGFDPDDDYEYCPQLTDYPQIQNTPMVSATLSPPSAHSHVPPQEYSSPARRVAQGKKALDIINPLTGQRVSSPKSIR